MLPRLVIGICTERYSLPRAQTECRSYFKTSPLIRAVLLIKFFGRWANDTVASVAILYRRDAQDKVVVDDVVSFGTAALHPTSLSELDRIHATRRVGGQEYRDLSGGGAQQRAEVRIPAADLYFGTRNVPPRGGQQHPRAGLVFGLNMIFDMFWDHLLSDRTPASDEE